MKARAPSVRPSVGIFALLLPLAPLVLGCASESDAVEKRLASLRDEIQKLQNDNDRVNERLEAIELRQAREESRAAEAKSAKSEPSVVTRPRLKVLRLAPGEEGEETEASPEPSPVQGKDAPRMLLKGQGKELELQQGR